jgi:hypothetical protein
MHLQHASLDSKKPPPDESFQPTRVSLAEHIGYVVKITWLDFNYTFSLLPMYENKLH